MCITLILRSNILIELISSLENENEGRSLLKKASQFMEAYRDGMGIITQKGFDSKMNDGNFW